MKNILFISLLIFITCTTQEENAQQQMFDDSEKSDTLIIEVEEPKVTFRMALDSLVNLRFQYEVKEFRHIAIDSASVIFRVNRSITEYMEGGKEPMDSVPINNLQSVQYAFLKGKRSMRTRIEEWTFINSESIKEVIEYIEQYREKTAEWIEISGYAPFSYHKIDNKLYVINTAGYYMHGEAGVLKEALIKYLKYLK